MADYFEHLRQVANDLDYETADTAPDQIDRALQALIRLKAIIERIPETSDDVRQSKLGALAHLDGVSHFLEVIRGR